MGLPIVVIEGWPVDRVAIVSAELAAVIKTAMDAARQINANLDASQALAERQD